jgi:hypothetical protein
MGGRDLHEVIVRKVGEEHVARQREVGAIELQVETGGHDGLVFRLHRVGERGEVGVPRGVMLVLQEQADHTGARGVHEAPLDAMGPHRGLQIRDILPQLALPPGFHLADASGPGEPRRAVVILQSFQEAG